MKIETKVNFIPHTFSNEREEEESRKLTTIQRQGVTNLLLDVMNEKLQLTPSMEWKDEKFNLQHEYLRGQMNILQYILSLDDNARTQTPSN